MSHNGNCQCLLSWKESAVEAVQYVNGDGGFIVSKHFPRLTDYLKECSIAISTLGLDTHDYDAMELGHVLQDRSLGVVSVVLPRRGSLHISSSGTPTA